VFGIIFITDGGIGLIFLAYIFYDDDEDEDQEDE